MGASPVLPLPSGERAGVRGGCSRWNHLPTSVGAHPVRDRSVTAYLISTTANRGSHASPRSRTGCAPTVDLTASSAMRCAAKRHEPSLNPLCGGEGRTIRPRKGARQDVGHFSSGQEPGRKARPPLTHWLGTAQTAPRGGGSFFWLLFLTPGILPSALRAGFAVRTRSCACVSKQRKVTRIAAAARKPAAGEPDRDHQQSRLRPSIPKCRTCRPPRKTVAHRVRSYSGRLVRCERNEGDGSTAVSNYTS